MILKDGSVKVADFGIARLLSVQNTLTQEALGSVHYISPEQAKGGQIDARSDIYSVGVVMYEMLTSRLPFVGDSAVSVAIQHISAIPLLPRDINPDIPPGLEEITMHAMESDVNMRFTTADEMLNDLEEFRKRPGIIFGYAASSAANRQTSDIISPYETQYIPREAIAATEMRSNRPIPPVVSNRPKSDMTSDEYRAVKKRSSSTATLIGIGVVVVIIVILLALFILPIVGEWFNQEDEVITIPKFVGKKYDDIIINEEYAELFTFNNPTFEANNDVAEGIVISQDPADGRERKMPLSDERINIRLTVSTGSEPPETMPDLIGIHHADARNQLINLHLDLDIQVDPVTSDEVERDRVISTVPRQGDPLARGNTVVITYSLGPEEILVQVPDMRRSTETQLLAEFAVLDLVAVIERGYDDSPEGTVTFISRIGEMVPAGTRINVIISRGPAPTPTPTPTPEPTTPPPTPPPDPATPEPPAP